MRTCTRIYLREQAGAHRVLVVEDATDARVAEGALLVNSERTNYAVPLSNVLMLETVVED